MELDMNIVFIVVVVFFGVCKGQLCGSDPNWWPKQDPTKWTNPSCAGAKAQPYGEIFEFKHVCEPCARVSGDQAKEHVEQFSLKVSTYLRGSRCLVGKIFGLVFYEFESRQIAFIKT